MVVIVLVVSLCFFIVPIKVGPDKTGEDAELFANYVARYNKPYRDDPAEYKERFEHFQVKIRIPIVEIAIGSSDCAAALFPSDLNSPFIPRTHVDTV